MMNLLSMGYRKSDSLPGVEEGIFENVSAYDYHYGKYRKCLGSSGLKLLQRSAAHYKESRNQTEDHTKKDAFIFGQAYHHYVLERDTFFDHWYVTQKITRSTRNGKPAGKWKNVVNAAGNKKVLWVDDFAKIKKMTDAMEMNRSAAAILKNPGKFEQTYIWKDDWGIWCKCRTDLIIENIKIIVDLKSTTNASPFGFPKNAANYGYDLSAGHYTQGVSYLTGKTHTFTFLAQEKDPPFASCVFSLDHGVLMQAFDKIDPLKQAMAKALRTGVYEGYPDEVIPLQLPHWYR